MVTAPELSLRGAKRRGNLAVHSRITGYSRRNRNCLPEIATGAKRPRNDNSDSLAPLNHCCNTCSCQRRSVSAATDAIGACRINGGLYGLQVPSRDCTPRALPRASRSGRHVGRWPPRNDKSGAILVLSTACSDRQHCAGPGCPLPYNAWQEASCGFPLSIIHLPHFPHLPKGSHHV